MNPGLVAVIGNKGNGKSALADVLGLLGETRQHAHFSFLHPSKFRSGKGQRASHFEACLEWYSGQPTAFVRLSNTVSTDSIELIKYLPQSYVEHVCNELNSTESSSAFDRELGGVIFSHVPRASRLGMSSLQELIDLKTDETNSKLLSLRSALAEVNDEIAILEEMGKDSYAFRLAKERSECMREYDAHLALKPAEVLRPELDDPTQKELSATSRLIELENIRLTDLGTDISLLEETERESAMSAVAIKRFVSKVRAFELAFETLRSESNAECAAIGVSFEDLVTFTSNLSPVLEVLERVEAERAAAAIMLDEMNPDGMHAKLTTTERAIFDLTTKLDSAGKKHQEYLSALSKWEQRVAILEGDESTPGTLKYIDLKISEIGEVAGRLAEREAKRRNIGIEIYKAIESLSDEYRDLYAPVQRFITEYAKHNPGVELDFKVNIQAFGLERSFLGFINQGKRGTFYGADEGYSILRRLLTAVDWSTEEGALSFAASIVDRLKHDYREESKKSMNVADQLKQGIDVRSVYDFVFGLEYLQPKYQLEWAGQPLHILSPGERGTVLLLFYLLVDKGDHPLVIDQPEENLDNQTVYRLLVPALKKARDRRQVIIVTHNPNLAVVCDADQIVYAHLDKKKNHTLSYSSGAIENPSIGGKIVDVLEGTKPAFENRGSKYRSILSWT